MEQMLSMFNSLMADNNNTNNNINSLKADIVNSNNAIEAIQAENAAIRMELLARIDSRSRLS